MTNYTEPTLEIFLNSNTDILTASGGNPIADSFDSLFKK